MKFSPLLFAMLAAVSGNAFSAVDYSYCQKQFNTFVQPNKPCMGMFGGVFTVCTGGGSSTEKNEDSSYYPFELTADGKIKAHPTLNYKTENGKEIVYSKNKDTDYETIITRNDKGEITGIDTNYAMKTQLNGGGYGAPPAQTKSKEAPFVQKNESNVKLEIKNGKCIPSRVDTVNSLGDESRQDVNFDAKLCRNVAQFFKKNPEAASCFDKNLMDKAQNIFKDFYKDNKDVYGDTKPNGFTAPRPQRTKLKSAMNQGMYGGGYGFPGTGGSGGIGIGMGMGMPGATTDQMLTPMMPSIDSILGAAGGFGTSPVVSAMQIMTLCQGGGWGPSVFKDVISDDSIWKTESQSAQKTDAASAIEK